MKKFVFILLIISSFKSYAQLSPLPLNGDNLSTKRNLFTTNILHDSLNVDLKTFKSYCNETGAQSALKQLEKSKIFSIAAPIVTATGVLVCYETLKGTPKTFLDKDGTLYHYKARSFIKLVGGVGIFAVGVCLLEFSNDFKKKSVKLYNNNLKTGHKTQTSVQFGITPSNSVGLFCKL